MGNSRWNANAWDDYATQTQTKSHQQIYRSTGLDDSLNPAKFDYRESVDSVANPNSTPIILATDVTGSMGHLSKEIISKDLGVIMQQIYDDKPVSDPHILMAAIGDAYCDFAPFQATQFEADISITEQGEKLWLEGHGGGNGGESYTLAWLFAHRKVHADAITKRGKKGFLFTIGDENVHDVITPEQALRVLNIDLEVDLAAADLLDQVTQNWEVFHLCVGNGYHSQAFWKDLLGERHFDVDHTAMGEIITSTMALLAGQDLDTVVNKWSGNTAVAVRSALTPLAKVGTGGITAI